MVAEVLAPAEKPHVLARGRAGAPALRARSRRSPSPTMTNSADGCRRVDRRARRAGTSSCCLIAVRRPTIVTTGVVGSRPSARRAVGARGVVDRDQRREVESERHDGPLVRRGRCGSGRAGRPRSAARWRSVDRWRGQQALDRDERAGVAEIPFETVAVIRVDRARPRRGRPVVRDAPPRGRPCRPSRCACGRCAA